MIDPDRVATWLLLVFAASLPLTLVAWMLEGRFPPGTPRRLHCKRFGNAVFCLAIVVFVAMTLLSLSGPLPAPVCR